MTDKQIHVTVIPEQERINVVFGHGVHETQADWNQQDAAASDYIKNKPPETTAGEGITITDGVVSVDTESEVWESKQDALAFGDGLKLNGDELSVNISDVISAGDGVTINNGEISIDTSDAQDGEILFAIAEEVNGETKLVVRWGIPPTGNYVDLMNLPKINGVTLVGNKSTADLLIPVYTDMIGATASTAGTSGLVPAPAAGDNTRFLRGDGSWQDVPHQDTTYTAGANINIDANNNNAISVSSGSAANTQFLKSDGNGGAVWSGALVRSVNNITGDLIMYPQMGSGANALFFSPQMSASDASGDYSEAHGYQTKSAGSGSVTFGYKTKTDINASYSEAHGSNTYAKGNYSAAFGGGTVASGANSFTIGTDTIASNTNNFAMGSRTVASGSANAFAGGDQSYAEGTDSIAIGYGVTSDGFASIAFGYTTYAHGNASLATGINTRATGNYSTALGTNTLASGTESTAIGRNSQATGTDSFASGQSIASGLRSASFGYGTTASGVNSASFGQLSRAEGAGSIAVGASTTADQDNSLIVGYNGTTPTNALFTVANGAGISDRATAFNVFKNGDIAAGSNWSPTADNHLATKKYVDDHAGGTPDWSDIQNKPTFATVATSGDYDDLLNKPSIPAAQIQADWNEADNTALDYIKNKPTIPAAQIQSDWSQADNTKLDYIKNKPSLATVATSGSYNDLLNQPTIPDISGCEVTSNKVTALSVASTDTQYPSAKCVYDELGNKQNTLTAGTGISIVGDTISATGGSARLPSAYQEIEYIERNGKAYIDTGFQPNNNTRVVAKISLENANSQTYYLFGARESLNSKNYSIIISNSKSNFRSDYSGQGTETALYSTFTYLIDKNKNVTKVNNNTATENSATFTTPFNMFIFTMNTNGTASDSAAEFRVYSCKIYDNGTLVRNFIPCYLKADETQVGLYDLVNNQFYTNAGSGTFTKGADV